MPTLSQLSQMGGFNMRKKRPTTVTPPYMQSPTMAPADQTQMQTGGGDPYAGGPTMGTQPVETVNGPRLPPIVPPSAGAISPQPGGAGWGPQTATGPASGRGFGHSYVNPYPGMTGAERVAAKNAEIEAEMAANHAARLAQRQENQAMRAQRQANPYDDQGNLRPNRMEQMFGNNEGYQKLQGTFGNNEGYQKLQGTFGNNEGYQKLQGTFQQKPGTLPYGIPTDPAGFGQFLAGGNFDPNQARTLQQMLAQLKAMSSDGMPQEVRDAQQANIARLEAALAGYAPAQGMNPTFTPPA